MAFELRKLRQERGEKIHAARALLDKAEGENRDLTDEETSVYDKLMEEQSDLQERIARGERHEAIEKEAFAASRGDVLPHAPPVNGERGAENAKEKAMAAFRSWLTDGTIRAPELRALQADIDTAGGYIVPPEQFIAQLIKFVDDMVFIRPRATVIPVPMADSLGVPSLDTDPADADWTVELGTGSADSDMAFGKRELKPSPLAKRIKVSATLLRKSALPAEQLVQQRLAYKFGITEEKGFLTGSGAGQPLGLFTASSDGISTGRDVSTGNAETEIRVDGLIEAKYSLKGNYWPRAEWIFHRSAVKQIAKLKDGEGQYIWRPTVIAGEPDRLLSFAVNMSEYAPSTFTSGSYVGILGDFSNYWIADSLSITIQRLVELYAETNQIGFIGRLETDGMPVLAEAFARVKLA